MSFTSMFPASIESFDAANPDHVVTALCLSFAVWCLVASWATGTHSHVDRLWSVTPIVYVAVYCYYSEYDPRCLLLTSLVTIWGTRLTYNFARKGGYSAGEQDYRWPVLHSLPILQNKIIWQVFNVSFIAWYQHALLLLISAGPMSDAFERKGKPLDRHDLIATCCFLGFLTLESVADQQQWRFQQAKHEVKGFPPRSIATGRLQKGIPHERFIQILTTPKLLRGTVYLGFLRVVRGVESFRRCFGGYELGKRERRLGRDSFSAFVSRKHPVHGIDHEKEVPAIR